MNHAVVLTGLVPGARYRAQVRVASGTVVAFQSEPCEFTAAARPTPPPTRPERVRLEVREPSGTGRAAWPVTSGIPFRQGALAGPADACLLDHAERPLPAQFEALAWWPDGSVRWLLVDFVAATVPGTPAAYWLATGPTPRRAPVLEVAQPQGNAWRLDTGPLRLVVDPAATDLLGGLSADRDGDGRMGDGEVVIAGGSADGQAWLVAADGQRLRAGPPDTLRVETNGPVRATVRLEGDFVRADGQRQFRYRARLTAWRGLGLLRLQWTVGNNASAETFTPLTAASLHLPLAGSAALLAGFDREALAPLPPTGALTLLQDYDDRFTRRHGERVEVGRRAAGLVTVRRGETQMRVQVRDFWQTYPKGLAVDATGVRLDLLPALPPDQYAAPADRTEVASIMKFYGYAEGKYLIKSGMEWTADILLEVSGPRSTGSAAPGEHFQESLLAQADPEVYCGSGAFWEVDPWRAGEFPGFQAAFDSSFANLEKGRQERGEYGWMNYGDWWGERAWNWGNSEYDLPYVLAVNFAQTGRLEVFWRGDQMVRHNTTIDVVHYPWTQPFRELVYAHSVGHVGGFFDPNDPRITNRVYSMKGFIAGARDGSGGHTYQGGNFLYGFLTGDRRTLEVAEAVCRNQASTYTPNWSFGIERACGWALYNAMSAYESTLDPFYLNAARLYLEKVFELQDPATGGWRMPQGPPECECTDAPHVGGKAFAAGVLLHGLAMVDRVQPDARVQAAIGRGADWLIDVSWNEAKEGFRYKTGCPKFANSGWYTTLVTDGIAYAYELSRDARYRDFLVRTLPKPLVKTTGSGPSSGKDFASHFRHLPHVLHYVKRWGLTDLPLPPAPLAVHVRRRVFLDAQGHGDLTVVARNPRAEAVSCEVRSAALPDGVTVVPASAVWQAQPGIHAGPRLRLTVTGPATGPVRLTLVVGEAPPQSVEVTLLRPQVPAALGAGLGFVGPAEHYSLAALRAVGAEPVRVADLATADLGAFRALVVGSDVLGREGSQLAAAAARLAGFVQAGGRLAFLQLNDQDWPADLLPYDLLAQDDDGRAGDLAVPGHGLFAGVSALRPALCYDTLAYADPAWTVLARDHRGGPAIVSAAYGRGQILVIQPSVDRWAEAKPTDTGLPAETGRLVMANLRRWCSAP